MKKVIIGILIFSCVNQIVSQNNLVFNQVLEFRVSDGQSVTVPEGKVWKIEGASGNIRLVKANVQYGSALTGALFTDAYVPIWVSEGTQLASTTDTNYSIIEFNVVPFSSSNSNNSGGLSSEGLQFSRVINYSDDHQFTPSPIWHDYEPIEIPEGKVWKITSINVASMSISSNPQINPFMFRTRDQTFVTIGDIITVFDEGTQGLGGFPYNNRSDEVWLNEGLKTIKVTNGESEKIRLTFTAIEYNIP